MSAPQITTEAPKRIKATSLRDSLGKTVRLLTKSGIDVQFRGHQPMVLSKGNKAVRLVLPELNDDAPTALLEAIHGYLDHEVGHIFYTPFARAARIASNGGKKAGALANIVEDIRLEKLLPRDLPGTKENLERMYEKFIPTMIDPAVQEGLASGDPGRCFSCVLVPGMRALAGQKQFQTYMDVNNHWQHLRPLIVKMPMLATRLRALETYDDVESLVEDMIAAMTPPPPPVEEKEPEREPDAEKQVDPFGGDDSDDDDDGADGDPGDDEGDDTEGDEPGDDKGSDDEKDGGKGHGDGSGVDDEEGDAEEEEGNCAGGDGDSEDEKDEEPSDNSGGGAEAKPDETEEAASKPGDGKTNVSLTDALKQLEPNQRRALFMYKNRNATVDAIAKDLDVDANTAVDLLRNGRRRLREIMKGSN